MFCIATSTKNISTSATHSSSPTDMDIVSTFSSDVESIASANSDIIYITPDNLPLPQLNAIRFDNEDIQVISLHPSKQHAAITVTQEKKEDTPKIEIAQALLNLAKDATKNVADEVKQRVPIEVRLVIEKLSYLVNTQVHSPQENPIDKWDFMSSSSSFGWDQDSDLSKTWPTSSTTPPQGDDMHPPSLHYCGQNPGSDWEINIPGKLTYVRYPILDPVTKKLVVAPFVKFDLDKHGPKVYATYSKGYTIFDHLLTATPVDYICPPLTIEQLCIFKIDEPFAPLLTKTLNEHFPINVIIGVIQYRYYKSTQCALRKTINELFQKEQKYLEKSLEVLSELENANVLGRLHAHLPDITVDTIEDACIKH